MSVIRSALNTRTEEYRANRARMTGILEDLREKVHAVKQGGGERTAEVLDCPFLGSVPLDAAVVEGGDAGVPIVVSKTDGPHAEAFTHLAEAVAAELSKQQARKLSIF